MQLITIMILLLIHGNPTATVFTKLYICLYEVKRLSTGRSYVQARGGLLNIQNCVFFLPHLHSTPPKISLFILAQFTTVTNGQTHGPTDIARRHRPRLCIAFAAKIVTVISYVRLQYNFSFFFLAQQLYLGTIINLN